MVPKVIHYCWFGHTKKPKLVLDCLKSWKLHLPDYEIIEWNENNFSHLNNFARQAYEHKKWAFVADYVRIYVLYHYGGIYLDTDMLLIKSLNGFLNLDFFAGYEEPGIVSGGIIGTTRHHSILKNGIDVYDEMNFPTNINSITIPLVLTKIVENHAISNDKVMIFPSKFFYPLPNKEKANLRKWKQYCNPSTVAVHLWAASWVDYNEFQYLENRKYNKAFTNIFKSLRKKNNWNLRYFKKLLSKFKKGL